MGPIAEGKDIIILTETNEHDSCKVLDFEGYAKISVWNEGTETGKGHGGITFLIKEAWGEMIKVEKMDPNKQFTWLKITENGAIIWLAACYFAPQNSKVYKKRKMDNEDPFSALKKDISVFSSLGEIVLMGDFNATMVNNQSTQLVSSGEEDNNPLWLEEVEV